MIVGVITGLGGIALPVTGFATADDATSAAIARAGRLHRVLPVIAAPLLRLQDAKMIFHAENRKAAGYVADGFANLECLQNSQD